MHDMSRFEAMLHVAAGLMDELDNYDEKKKQSFALYYNLYVHELSKDINEDEEYLYVMHDQLQNFIFELAQYVLERSETKVSI